MIVLLVGIITAETPIPTIIMSLTINVISGTPVRVRVAGHLDSETAAELDQSVKTVMSANTTKTVVFDLAELEYISSAGLRCFVRVMKAGGQPLLVNLKPNVEKVFNMVRVLPVKNLFRDEDALSRFLQDAADSSG